MDDQISRQAAIDALSVGKEILNRVLDETDVVGTDREKYSWGLGLIESCIKDIEELPPAQPERKKGKWINDEHDMPRCSECGYMPEYNKYIDDYYYSDFCPNCGAEMRGEQDE